MAIRGPARNYRLRTIWTPEMDRYFIDLMLEQVNEGNRLEDNLFSKRTWKHMGSLFNAKFKFEFEKDVLKNRHKTLRNLYRSVKNLLDQSGFSWDHVRQMVTANNNVWDEYIKANPGAKSFRIKSIPYYNDLCLIYGNSIPDRKGNVNCIPSSSSNNKPLTKFALVGDNFRESSSHSADVATTAAQPENAANEALHEITIGEDYGIGTTEITTDPPTMQNITEIATTSRCRTYWQPPMDRYFIDLLLEQVQKANKIDGVFRRQAWVEMIKSFNAKFGFNYDMEVLKNRYKSLRRQYNVIRNLLDLDGFVWDDARQMVIADDHVWQYHIKAYSSARQYMTRPVPYYKDLCVICDPSVELGDCLSGQGLDLKHEIEEGKFSGILSDFQSPETSVSSEDKDGNVQESERDTGRKNKCKLENMFGFSGHGKKLGGEQHEGMASAIREMASVVSSLRGKKQSEDDHINSVSIEDVVGAVQALPEMDEDLILDACDFLEDEKKAKTFLALDVKLRKKWLLRKLRLPL